ncbi:MAG: ABC transporter substrate-binding protein [Psychrobacter sp.]|nr:ABC transporter substrate-binding protein [Psychrobacter sp.]
MFNPNRFIKPLLWGSLSAALLTGCNQPTPENNNAPVDTKASAAPSDTEMKKVDITAIVEHPALDAVREGIIAQLADDGYVEGKNLKINFQSAQGNSATAGQISKQFVGEAPDVIVAIATPSAQSVAAATNTIPIVFSAVTDPVTAKLVNSLEGSGTNVTGASNASPYEPQIALMKQLIPNLKNVGYVYSPGEVNSVVILKDLKERLEPMGIKVHEAPAASSNDIAMAARGIAGKVDMIYTSTDNHVVSAYESLYQVAKQNKIPLIASDTDTVSRGAAAAMGVNYNELGRETGKIVTRILKGEAPGTIPVYRTQSLDLYVSPKHAKEQGFTLPQAVLDEAKKVVE